ncbi:MAG: hypothetical protein EXR73_13165 [Myxococcales bacterium]|nr:hypothetical protein [Myxococcales bacterium]
MSARHLAFLPLEAPPKTTGPKLDQSTATRPGEDSAGVGDAGALDPVAAALQQAEAAWIGARDERGLRRRLLDLLRLLDEDDPGRQ